MTRNYALLPLVGVAIVLFLWGANRQSERVNKNPYAADQIAYMDYAESIWESDLWSAGDRNRMPIFPGLMSIFYEAGLSDYAFFARGKNVGIAVGLLGLAAAYFVFRRVSRTLDALTGALVATFTVFVYKSPYFQADVLYYTLAFILFYLLIALVRRPRVTTAALAGLVGGIAHLTKASVLPAVLLAALLMVVRAVIDSLRRPEGPAEASASRPGVRSLLVGLGRVGIFVGCFVLVVFPYIQDSRERFGHYFYNVNSTFYMWYDSWDEVKQGTRAHGDRDGWPDMPQEQIPSFSKYVREHRPGEILGRIVVGVRELRTRVTRSYGYAEFFLVYAAALALLFAQNSRPAQRLPWRRIDIPTLVFVVGYFTGYILLYAWYTPIAGGDRLILSLFLPAMLLVVWSLTQAQDHAMAFDVFGVSIPASSLSPAVLLFLSAYVIAVFPHRVSSMFGGG